MSASGDVLHSYLECPDEQSADDLLAKVIFEQAEPLVRAVLMHRLSGAASLQDREDLAGEVVLELLSRLRQARAARESSPIGSFPAYVRTTAHHACDAFFRRRYPRRHRLKNRLRYLLRADPRFALWTDAHGTAVCGKAVWQAQSARPLPPAPTVPPPSTRLDSALAIVFAELDGPAELDDIAGLLDSAWGPGEAQVPLESLDAHPSPQPDPTAQLDRRRRLQRVWDEILLLPAEQRAALLLHLRDDQGGPALALLPPSGVASLSRIAAALSIPESELAELWCRLPLPDSEIAPRLCVSRQQVINLRSAARQRLARRMAAPNIGKADE